MTLIAQTLEAFFCERLISQRNASPQTIAAYSDALRLLLSFAQTKTGKQPYQLDFDDLDAQLIGAFLKHLETERGNSARTRNARLGRSTRSTGSPPCATPSTPPRSRG